VKVVIIGATGTIGQAVTQALLARHEIVSVGGSTGDHQVDIASKLSIRRLFEAIVPFDAVVCAAGQAKFGRLESLSDDGFQFSISNKLTSSSAFPTN
jgi:nucleoside-diphosphate-sugar epimerase